MTTWTDAHEYVTNLLPYSYDFSQWTKSAGMEVVSNYENSPFADDGLATRLSDTSATVLSYVRVALSGMAENVSRCFSVYVKKDQDTNRVCDIRMMYTSGAFNRIRINTQTGEISSNATVLIASYDYGIEDCGDFWRGWISSSTSSALLYTYIYPSITTDLSNSVMNNVATTGSVVIYGAQLEEGTSPTGLITTNGSTVTSRQLPSWANDSDETPSWGSQSDQTESWAKMVTAGYVELGYVDYIYVDGDLISYAVDDANNTWTVQTDATTTWQ